MAERERWEIHADWPDDDDGFWHRGDLVNSEHGLLKIAQASAPDAEGKQRLVLIRAHGDDVDGPATRESVLTNLSEAFTRSDMEADEYERRVDAVWADTD